MRKNICVIAVINITDWMGGLYTPIQTVISGFHSVALGW